MFKRLCLIPVFCCCTTLYGQQMPDSIQQLQTVEVVAGRYREIIPAQRLTGKKLEALNSFSVTDAIRYFSGVQIKDYGGIGGLKTVDIRSMGTNHMGVFYDGIQLGNAQNGQIDLGKFSLDNIEEISLYNGQKSDIFQSAKDFGSAGTIYLRTRRPQFEKGKQTNLKAVFKTGSFHLVNPSVLWEQKWSDNVSSSFNAEYIYSSGKYKFRYREVFRDGTVGWDTTAVRQNGDIHALRLEGGLVGAVEGGKWNIKGYYYDSERGIPGVIRKNVWKNPQRQWDRNFFTQGSFQKAVSDRYDLLINFKYANDKMRYVNPDTTLMLLDNRFTQQEIYISAANKYSILPTWDVSLSADYQWNVLDGNLNAKDFMYPKRHTLLVAMATALEWGRFKGQASLLGTFVSEKSKREQLDKKKGTSTITYSTPDNKNEYTPAVFLSYRPFENHDLTVRAFYKHIFRMPTFNDLYYVDLIASELKPEYTTQYSLGFQYAKTFNHHTFKRLTFNSDGYFNQITNKIVSIPQGNGQYRWMMMNLGVVEIRGLDVNGQIDCRLPYDIAVSGMLSYTYQKAQDFTYPKDNAPGRGSYGGQIAYIPWHSGSAIINANYQDWTLNYSFIYVGERYHNSANTTANYERPWYTHDISISKNLRYEKIRYRLTAEVNNIANQYYDVIRYYPMPGINYRFSLQINI